MVNGGRLGIESHPNQPFSSDNSSVLPGLDVPPISLIVSEATKPRMELRFLLLLSGK